MPEIGEGQESLFADKTPPKEDPDANLPDPLKGKSKEEMYNMLREEHDRELQAKENELLKKKLAEVPAQQPVYQPPQPTFQQPAQETSLYTDPDKFMEEQLNKRLAPLVNTFQQSSVELAKEQFKSAIPPDEWEKYGGEMEQFVENVDPRIKGSQPLNTWKAAQNYVRGKHLDEIADARASNKAKELLKEILAETGADEGKLGEYFNRSATPAPRSSLFQAGTGTIPQSSPPRKMSTATQPKARLDSLQQKIADAFGMSSDEYTELSKYNTDVVSQLKGGQK